MSYLRRPAPAYKDPTVLKAEELRNEGLALATWAPAMHHIPVAALQNATPPNTPSTITSHHFSLSSSRSKDRFLPSDDHVAHQISTWAPTSRQVLIMMTLSVLSFMVALDSCIIVTSLNAIAVDLDLTTTQGIWIGTAYLLASAVTMPFLAEASHVFGRVAVLRACIGSFTLGTTFCCLATDVTPLLVGRTFQGIGGAGIMVLSLVIFTDIVPLRFRPKWYGSVLGAWALGNCLGPVLGGIIAHNSTWRWVFYVMFPFCVAGLLLSPSISGLKAPPATLTEKIGRIDWIGGVLFILSRTLFLIAISWGGMQYSWLSPGTIVPLCLGAAGLIWTFIYEAKWSRKPFLRRSLFWSISSIVTYICGTFQGLIIYGQLYYIPLYFLAVRGYNPVRTGLSTLPIMATLVPSSIVTGALVTRTAKYRWPIWLGWALTTLGSSLTVLFDRNTSTMIWATVLIILGLGHGAVLNAQNFAAQAMCRQGEEGPAAAMYAFVRQSGMALGVNVGGTVFQNVMSVKLRWEGLDIAIARESEAFVDELQKMPSESSEKVQILDAYIYGLRGVYLLYSGISGTAFLLSMLLRHFNMAGEVMSDHQLEDHPSAQSHDPNHWAH